MTIDVLICDDDPIVRSALSGYLEAAQDIVVTATAGTAEEALAEIAASVPDVVLMDLSMPGMGGLAGTDAILREHPSAVVVLLTTFGTDEQVREAIGHGASGFLLKSATADSLVAAVRAASAGAGVVITPEVAAALARESSLPRPAADAPADEQLPDVPTDEDEDLDGEPTSSLVTERELQVLHLLCRADTNTQIAEQLMLSESTVKKHVTSLMAKLDASSRLQIAVRAFELGLAEPPAPRS